VRFDLSEEQQALQRATASFLATHAESARAAALDEEQDFDRDVWRRGATEIGLSSIAVGEKSGGAGGTTVDLAVIMEEAGRALSTLPLWTAATSGLVIDQLTDLALSGDLLEQLLAGGKVPVTVGLRATDADALSVPEGECLVSGRVAHVVAGPWTDEFLVVLRGRERVRVLLVERTAPGVDVSMEKSLDPTRPLAVVAFANAPATELSSPTAPPGAVNRIAAESSVLLAAEQVGVAQGALDMAVEYAKTRQQFGRAIGSFQALKHLLADQYVDLATARDVARYASWAFSNGLSDEEAQQLARMTRTVVTPRASAVTAANLQVHGGIGYTWEHPAHLYYKRALTSAHLLGEIAADLDALASAIGLED
jgi:alkylation response protein AidB-like acyl-CoA dehydrogenase